MELNQAELLLIDFLKDIKEVINFKAILGKTLPFESPKQKFKDLVMVFMDTNAGDIIDVRFSNSQHIVSSDKYLLLSQPDVKSITKLLAFHEYLMRDLGTNSTGHGLYEFINGMFRYTKKPDYHGVNSITHICIQMNCKVSSIYLINLLELLHE